MIIVRVKNIHYNELYDFIVEHNIKFTKNLDNWYVRWNVEEADVAFLALEFGDNLIIDGETVKWSALL